MYGINSLYWSVIRKVLIWTASALDYILESGDRVYKNLGRFGILSVDDLPSEISVTDVNVSFNKNYLSLENGLRRLVEDFLYLQAIHLSDSKKGNDFLMFICGFTVAVILYNDSYYLFDSHSRNQHSQMVVNGQSVLLKFSQLSDLEKYIETIYLLQRYQRRAYFQIQYIDVIVCGDASEILRDFHHKKKLNQQMKHRRDKISQKKQRFVIVNDDNVQVLFSYKKCSRIL